MHRELIVPFSLRIGEETLRKGYEEQDQKYKKDKIYLNAILNLILNIALICIVGSFDTGQDQEKIVSLSILGILLTINILLLISYYCFQLQLRHIQSIYELMAVQVILYISKLHLQDDSKGNNLLNGMVIGACIFNSIIGFSFVNKIIMNLYAIFSMSIYQFIQLEGNEENMFFIIFAVIFIFISSSKGYHDEKQRRKLYIISQKSNYLGDSIITHTPVGIMATKFNDTTMKFELISMNAKAQQLLHMDQSQSSIDTFLKTFEIDAEHSFLNRSDLSNKQSLCKEQSGNNKKKQENEMSLFMQCRFHMMKMLPAYPRDLKQRMKKRDNSTGKSYILSGLTEKETDITSKNNFNNNINTPTVTAEVKQYSGFYNSLYLNLQFSTYTMMGDDKYAIFCINTDPYKRDYHNLKSRNNKYQSFFTNFWTVLEKSLVTSIRDWKSFFSEYQQMFINSANLFSPKYHLKEGLLNLQGTQPNVNYLIGQQNTQQPVSIRTSQSKKNSQKSQSDQKRVNSLQKILQINDGGYNQMNQLAINTKLLNSQCDEGLEGYHNSSLKMGSYHNMQFSPKKENRQQINGGFYQQTTSQDNSKEQGSMNFDYFCLTQESMNNFQQFQSIGNKDNIDQSFGICQNSPQMTNANVTAFPLNNNSINNIIINNNSNQISQRNQKQIQRMNYNSHKVMYDYQNWNTMYDMEFCQNVIVNQRQALQSAEQLDLDRLFTKILSIFEIIRIEKQIKIIKQIKIVNPQVSQNSKKLHIVLFNILHNAFLYCKYQSTILITVSDNQNCLSITVTNDILQEEENSILYYIQNQILQESKNFISSVTFDTLNQFSLNFNQSPDLNENINLSNNGSHLAILARKKGEGYGLRLSKFLLKSMGPSDRFKVGVKDQKFILQFDIYIDVNHQRKKQTSLFQRYKKNSAQINNNLTDPNQSNFNQINEEKQVFETVQYSPSEYNNSPNIKKLGQQIFFDRNSDNYPIKILGIDDDQHKIALELEETYNNNRNSENYQICQEFDKKSESVALQSDMSELCQSNIQGMSFPSQKTPNFVMQTKIQSLQFQTMQKLQQFKN